MNTPALPLDGHDLVTLLVLNIGVLAGGAAAALLWWRLTARRQPQGQRGRPLEVAAFATGALAVLVLAVWAWQPLPAVKPPTPAQLQARRQAEAQIAAVRARPGYRRWYPPAQRHDTPNTRN